jgi:CMP-N,N'-diacetyllegionaminic acid synthase
VSEPRVLALIPARGGSKGVKKKNLRQVDGISLVHRAVLLAKKSRCVTEIHVSTDDSEIADHVRILGDYAQFSRAPECATDDSRDEEVVDFVLDQFELRGSVFDYLVYLRPTAPCRIESVIDDAFSVFLRSTHARSVKAVSMARQHPYKMWWRDDAGFLSPVLPALHNEFDGVVDVPRQKLPVVVASSAAIDIVRIEDFRRDRMIHTARILGFEIPAELDIDVDTELDLAMAELVAQSMKARKSDV